MLYTAAHMRRVMVVVASALFLLLLGVLFTLWTLNRTSSLDLATHSDTSKGLFKLEPILSGLMRATYLTHAGDGSSRLFIVEQGGLVRVVQDGQLLSDPFLDLSSKVGGATWEQGLLSAAFHPNYEENGRFFVYYVANDDARSIIAEYRVSNDNPNQAASEETVLLEAANAEGIHYGGQLQFGPDGYLYISLGEGGYPRPELEPGATVTQKPPQNLSSLHGSILRLDVDSKTPYAIPADNPFVGKTGARGEIWAYGLRNPWRFSFDRDTDEMYLGDVGYQSAEELNIIRAGTNYGWPITEGPGCYVKSFVGQASCTWHKLNLRLQEPRAHYRFGVRRTGEDGEDAGVGSSSVTAGYVYRGEKYPSLKGQFFAADFVSGYVWALTPGKTWQVKDTLKTDFFVSSFGEDEAGELYLLDWARGILYQVVGSNDVASN